MIKSTSEGTEPTRAAHDHIDEIANEEQVMVKFQELERGKLALHCHLRPLVPPVVLGFNHDALFAD